MIFNKNRIVTILTVLGIQMAGGIGFINAACETETSEYCKVTFTEERIYNNCVSGLTGSYNESLQMEGRDGIKSSFSIPGEFMKRHENTKKSLEEFEKEGNARYIKYYKIMNGLKWYVDTIIEPYRNGTDSMPPVSPQKNIVKRNNSREGGGALNIFSL